MPVFRADSFYNEKREIIRAALRLATGTFFAGLAQPQSGGTSVAMAPKAFGVIPWDDGRPCESPKPR